MRRPRSASAPIADQSSRFRLAIGCASQHNGVCTMSRRPIRLPGRSTVREPRRDRRATLPAYQPRRGHSTRADLDQEACPSPGPPPGRTTGTPLDLIDSMATAGAAPSPRSSDCRAGRAKSGRARCGGERASRRDAPRSLLPTGRLHDPTGLTIRLRGLHAPLYRGGYMGCTAMVGLRASGESAWSPSAVCESGTKDFPSRS